MQAYIDKLIKFILWDESGYNYVYFLNLVHYKYAHTLVI
jgi:hypothetical protein